LGNVHANRPSIQRNVILGLLLALAAGAWAVLVLQSADANMDMTLASSTMGMPASLFSAIWVVMMVAMMFPPAVPMILTFHEVQIAKGQRGDAFVLTWVFVATYLSVWTLAGVAAYAGALASEAFAAGAALSPATAARIGAGLFSSPQVSTSPRL
jgi:predicted metal-binding membrane protein